MSILDDKITCCLKDAKAFLYIAQHMPVPLFNYNSPYITNLGIACELFLKAIAMKQNPTEGYQHRHKFDELLGDLPVDDKQKIETNFQTKSGLALNEFLRTCNNPFVEWRYQFEQKSFETNVVALETFAEILKDYCETL